MTWTAGLLPLLLLFGAFNTGVSLLFDVPPRTQKCMTDQISVGSLVAIDYAVVGVLEGKTNVGVHITDPTYRDLRRDDNIDHSVENTGSLSFHAEVEGDYQVCFHNLNDYAARIMLDLRYGVEARDYTEVARREHLMPVEKELRKLEDLVDEIHKGMLYMRERESLMRDTNESTNSRVLWFSLFSILMLVGIGSWQMMYMKKFFKSKKLI
uniref:Uncharacterized protein AlNc14C8G1078 n=1 Tax=Albugo laibachii Nc14 TaxID=890382 RepID=F0W1Z9_9STRA|nr:conserved hypothetical protein [Albugo laibachii Nc14]|eukprot:CCA15078.1 conserved hypothetical protein [Albugo laibachii Nc14]